MAGWIVGKRLIRAKDRQLGHDLSISEAARKLGTEEQRVRDLIHQNRIPSAYFLDAQELLQKTGKWRSKGQWFIKEPIIILPPKKRRNYNGIPT